MAFELKLGRSTSRNQRRREISYFSFCSNLLSITNGNGNYFPPMCYCFVFLLSERRDSQRGIGFVRSRDPAAGVFRLLCCEGDKKIQSIMPSYKPNQYLFTCSFGTQQCTPTGDFKSRHVCGPTHPINMVFSTVEQGTFYKMDQLVKI